MRGFIRAAIAVIVLAAVIIAILLIVSSLTAPPAKAPTVPTTPTIGTLVPTPGTPLPVPTAKATAKPRKTSGTKKDLVPTGASSVLGRALARRSTWPSNAAASPDGKLIAFVRPGSAYGHNPLVVTRASTGSQQVIGYGDPYVHPVWSADGTTLLYGRVAGTSHYPGAEWSLMETHLGGATRVLARQRGLDVIPLGWIRGRPAYLVATATDTALYTVSAGRSRYISKIITQAVTSAQLSPNGRFIAFAAPTNCGFCTLDVFDISSLKLAFGPSGAASERDFAWTRDSRYVVATAKRGLATVDPLTGAAHFAALPRGLPQVWAHSMRVTVGRSVVVTDSVTGERYRN